MVRLALSTNHKVAVGVLVFFVGVCILASNYYNEKKFQVFDEMNELYYEQLIELEEVEELEELPEETPIIVDSEVPTTSEMTTKSIVPSIDYTKYYIGYLSIPKINLKKGFTEIDNKYNNVNRNIQIISPSDYPNVINGNFIIAGHSGSTSVSFFKDLYKLALEDDIYITYQDTEYKYTIKNIYKVPKTGKVGIIRNKEKTSVTLITCTKGDKNTQTVYVAER